MKVSVGFGAGKAPQDFPLAASRSVSYQSLGLILHPDPLRPSMLPTKTLNSREIAALQKGYRRMTALFYGGIIAIPLGLACPCGLAAIVYRVAPEWSQPVALSGFFLPLVGLATALLVVGARSRYRRSMALATLADALGLRFTYQPPRDRLDFLLSFKFMGLPMTPHSGRGFNLMEGPYRNRPLTTLDYSFLSLLGYKHVVSRQTVAVFTKGFEALPTFAVVPQMWADKFRKWVLGSSLGKTFKVPDEEEFNRHFVVAGMERAPILHCLTPEVIDLFLEDKRLALEIQDGMLMVYLRETVLPAGEYEPFLVQVGKMARELTGAKQNG